MNMRTVTDSAKSPLSGFDPVAATPGATQAPSAAISRGLSMKHLFAESALLLSIVPGSAAVAQVPQYEDLMQDVVIAADLWSAQPEILSAAFGFEGIIGVPPFEFAVRAAGGTWIQMPPGTSQPPLRTLTSAAPVLAVPPIFGTNATLADAMPIVFSWPVLPSTVHPSDFLVHLSDGTSVSPAGVSIAPCHEFNERNVAVLVGELGNRLVSGEAGAIYPVQVDIVDDGSPLMLIGPGGALHSAVDCGLLAVGLQQPGAPSMLCEAHHHTNPHILRLQVIRGRVGLAAIGGVIHGRDTAHAQ